MVKKIILYFVLLFIFIQSVCVCDYKKDKQTKAEFITYKIYSSDVLDNEKEEIKEEKKQISSGEFIEPLSGEFTSGFGQRWGRLHGGIDLAAKEGTQIRAADSGRVIFAKDCGSYGKLIKIDHENGYVTYYAHCSKFNVNVGEWIDKGDVIAYVGNTGNSTGPHCHFEIRKNNVQKNPLNYITLS